MMVSSYWDLSKAVMGEGLVELSIEVRNVFLIAVVGVTSGSDSQLLLSDLNSPLEGNLRSLRWLLEV